MWESDRKVGINFRKNAIYFTIILLLVLSTVSLNNSLAARQPVKDTKPPSVKITEPLTGSVLSYGTITVKGTSSDIGGSGVKNVQVHVNNGPFVNALPKSSDWSSWTVSINIFSVGSQKIEAKATDNSGNTKLYYVTITTVDKIPPKLTPPANMTVEAVGLTTPVNLGTPTVNDDLDPNPIVSNDAPTGFAFGTTLVVWTATDSAGNWASGAQTIAVVDTTNPTINAPDGIEIEATSLTNNVLSLGTATAEDIIGIAAITNNAPDFFPFGETIVTWTATDPSGNSATATQKVTVIDTTAPVLIVPDDVVMDAISLKSTITIGSATAIDIDPNPRITNDAPTEFPLGNTIVTWTGTDFSGNSATATQTITINPTLYDNFDGQSDYLLSKGVNSPNGKWISYSTGYGENGVSSELLYLHPHLVPFIDDNGISHNSVGPAVRTTETFQDYRIDIDMRYDQTSRTDTQPKRWEEAVWLLFDHQLDSTHFRYFHVDRDGVAIGFYDGGTNPGSQQIINEARNGIQVSRVNGIYSADPVIKALTSYPPHVTQGQWTHITMEISVEPSGGRHIVVTVDGVSVYDFIHTTSFSGGSIMVYCEDAWISVDNVRITRM